MACAKCGAKVMMYDAGRFPGEERMLCVCGYSAWKHLAIRKPTHADRIDHPPVMTGTVKTDSAKIMERRNRTPEQREKYLEYQRAYHQRKAEAGALC